MAAESTAMRFGSILLAAVLLPAAVPAAQAPRKSAVIQRIIVKVNGEIFTQTDLEAKQVDALRDQNKQVGSVADLQKDEVLIKALAEVTPAILVDMIDELLLVQRGRELGASFSDANFKQALENIKKENRLNDEELKAAMAQSGMTMNELRQNLERQYLRQSVQRDEIMRNMTVTDQEARQYYTAHPNEFMKPATIMLRELFVEVPVSTQAGQAVFNQASAEAAKAKVDAARDRAMKGEDFAKLVGELSEAGSKANGGLIGPVVVTELSETLAKLVAPMKAGEITEPVRTPRGYTIFKLESKTPESIEPFDRVRQQVNQRIYDARIDGETKKHIEKLRGQAIIEWKDDTYKQMYEKAQKDRAK
jgi:peptidyl-prolyl cis-trans isomerase SurA